MNYQISSGFAVLAMKADITIALAIGMVPLLHPQSPIESSTLIKEYGWPSRLGVDSGLTMLTKMEETLSDGCLFMKKSWKAIQETVNGLKLTVTFEKKIGHSGWIESKWPKSMGTK